MFPHVIDIPILLIGLTNILLPSRGLMLKCHREQKFVKTSQDGLPALNAIKVTTALRATFCSTECLEHPSCESIVFDTSKSDDNCMLSSEVNGASSNEATVTYIKQPRLEKMCDINPCLHGGTCVDTCKDPFYACGCRPTYFEGYICEKNSICLTQPCQNGGTCSPHSEAPYYQCQCPAHWEGAECQINTRCNTNPCNNGGNCYTQSSNPYYYCNCPTYFGGTDCNTNSRCNYGPCANSGVCHTQSSHPYYHCHCTTWWGGYSCDAFLGIG